MLTRAPCQVLARAVPCRCLSPSGNSLSKELGSGVELMHVAHSSIAKLPSWEGIAFQSKSRAGVIVGADPRGLKALQWGLSGRHQHHHAAGWGRQSPAISPCITYYAAAAGHWQCWAQRPMWVTVWGTSVQRAPSQRPSSHSSPLSTTSTCFNRSSA